ncbi:MAG TPA: hypothetical protein VKY74_08060 [Chloroflexia bacterium]|nr:hypothetical protein [Chloroflexia bacterium]
MLTESRPLARPLAAGPRRPHPLRVVIAWELRRLGADWRIYLLPLATLAAAVFLTLAVTRTLNLDGGAAAGPGSAWAAFWLVATGLNILKVPLILLTATRVAHDYATRTHELVWTTPVPRSTLVWGRWLAGALLSAGLLVLWLLGLAATSLALRLVDPAHTLPPDLPALGLAWALMAPIDLFLVTASGFALCTRWPGAAVMVPASMAVVWLFLLPALPGVLPVLLRWLGAPAAGEGVDYARWVPAHSPLVDRMHDTLAGQYAAAGPLDAAGRLALGNTLVAGLPDLGPWLAHLPYAAAGVLLLAWTAWRFRPSA